MRAIKGGPGGAAYGLAGFLGCQFSTSAVGPATVTSQSAVPADVFFGLREDASARSLRCND